LGAVLVTRSAKRDARFKRQKTLFDVKPAEKPPKFPFERTTRLGTDKDGNRIFPARLPNGARPFGAADGAGNLRVAWVSPNGISPRFRQTAFSKSLPNGESGSRKFSACR
jgi:hypothetical protein